jgi:murein DD-endopeptidase MepM/ murein hydrolase activator NlpD
MATLPGIATVYVSATGYGLHVIIDHGGGLSSVYGHLNTVLVASGDLVTAGEIIGTVGSTGNATGPHLHFEIRRDGIAEDPRLDLVLP